MTDRQLDNLAARFEALKLPDVTFEQFCTMPRYYERLAQFRDIMPDMDCFPCPHYDGSCNGYADECPRVVW